MGTSHAFKLGAARGSDVKAPEQEESWFENAEVASTLLQCPGQVAGGASNAPASSKGPACPVSASRHAGGHSF